MRDILIVEDSRVQAALMRSRIINRFPDVQVRIAADPFEAREEIAKHSPDLVLLDIELPRMSGSQFLGFLMRSHPLPVVIVTATVEEGSERSAKLMEMGSRGIIKKANGPDEFARFDKALSTAIEEVLYKGKSAPLNQVKRQRALHHSQCSNMPVIDLEKAVITLGSSTGGPKALERVLSCFTEVAPPVFIAQHIPLRFVYPFIETLQVSSCLTIKLAEHGERAQMNHVYVAPPESNMRVMPGLRMEMSEPPASCRFVPNVDVLFSSIAQLRNYSVAAALLTGMGDDGARGMLDLKRNEAFTIAQNEETCAVYGMPARAVQLNAASMILPLEEIGEAIVQWYSNNRAISLASHASNQLDSML